MVSCAAGIVNGMRKEGVRTEHCTGIKVWKELIGIKLSWYYDIWEILNRWVFKRNYIICICCYLVFHWYRMDQVHIASVISIYNIDNRKWVSRWPNSWITDKLKDYKTISKSIPTFKFKKWTLGNFCLNQNFL